MRNISMNISEMPLEGILYNCKAINDYTAFERINQLLKKEAKFLPYRLVYSTLKEVYSILMNKFINLLPESNIKTGLKIQSKSLIMI